MNLLVLDSSGVVATAAIFVDKELKAEHYLSNKMTHSETLMPMIDMLFKNLNMEPADIDAVAVGAGPGSFTGLRIGAATAKGLCLALDKPLIPVSSLEGLAYNLKGAKGLVCPIMDARRNQVYTALYDLSDGYKEIIAPKAVDMGELLEELKGYDSDVYFLGDGLKVYMEQIEGSGVKAFYPPIQLTLQRASSFGVRAMEMYEQGEAISADNFAPVYLRLSQAERERLEREQKNG